MTITDYIAIAFAGGILLGTCFGMLLGIAVSVKIEDLRRWLGLRAARRSEREMRRRYTGTIGIETWKRGKRGTNTYGDSPEG